MRKESEQIVGRPRPGTYQVIMSVPARMTREEVLACLVSGLNLSPAGAEAVLLNAEGATSIVCMSTTFEVAETLSVLAAGRLGKASRSVRVFLRPTPGA